MKKAFQVNEVQEELFEHAFGILNDAEKRNAPEKAYLSGNNTLLKMPRRVAVMGNRHASPKGCIRARNLAAFLAAENITLVSGLTSGIREAVLKSAIGRNGNAIAVLEQSLDLFYPRSLRRLGRTIGSDHLLISPSGERTAEMEVAGAVIALISDAVIIADASLDSDVLRVGWEAIRLGRPVFICEELIAETISSDWPEEMIDHGAKVLTSENIRDELIANLPEVSRAEFAAFTFDD